MNISSSSSPSPSPSSTSQKEGGGGGGGINRELIVCAYDGELFENLNHFLINYNNHELQLVEYDHLNFKEEKEKEKEKEKEGEREERRYVVMYKQNNLAASRKQITPIVSKFFTSGKL
eukprot:TRINITY_DN7381_c0_g3_i1.p1 TRINITY_DN7381_c0_g3~~TRINITY_DN7381_c0_g3_i1.p1  ORF type:complete len:118 (-),score=58.05 TRINITY_DN7381_c0_g3_i1:54-407(-)